MRRFDDFYGCDALIGRLKGVAGEPVHAYLFCGPEGTGKRTLSAICARALNCAGAGERPCDGCPSCKRYLAGTHPDHIVLASDKAIGASEVRAAIERLSIRSYEGGRRTVIVEHADRMTAQAQNALLKTLEEPPEGAVFFLLAERTAGLLPTVKSRVRLIRFAELSQDALTDALIRLGHAPERAAQLAEIADGSVGKALALDKDGDYWALRERVTRSLSALHRPADVADAFALIKDDKAEARRALEVMEQAARARMRGGEEIGARLLQGVMRARKMLQSNVSWQSAVEMLYFDLARP
ncbi:MAG: DNA polymerase III subunit delta' [Eubacteriales bacterium]|nr:DNA polymerase III subunit delta' [Christensenellaceae bacterium]MEA5067027.1 DNA polymerase III subunit delta' [Eubacteriales bacterium]